MVQTDYYHGANERIIARVPADSKRILDVGCAAGRLGEILKQGVSREVWGIELIPAIAAEANARLDHVIVGDVEQMDPLPLPDRYFDCGICGDVLEHLKDPQAFLTRLRRHLAPGATLLVNVPNIGHWSVVLQLLQGQFNYEDKGLLDRTHLHFFTPSTFKDTLWEAGYLVTDQDALKLLDGGASRAIGQAAGALGFDPKVAEECAATYQQLFVAKPVPDPYTEPDKMAALVGPHIGKLGPGSKRASIVILTYNSMKTIETCLNSVLPTLSADDELILVDNDSKDGTPQYLEEFTRRDPRISVLLNGENFGFSKGCNLGLLRSKGEFLILLNPDTQVWPNWIEGLIAPFADERVGAVGPLSDNVCGDQFVGLYLPPKQLTSRDQIANTVNSGPNTLGPRYLNTKLLIGFCLALRRSLLEGYGLLEEKCFLGADDLEVSWRLRTLGFLLAVATTVFVAHETHISFASVTSDQNREAIWASDRALISKLRRFFQMSHLPSSGQLWANDIFSDAQSRTEL